MSESFLSQLTMVWWILIPISCAPADGAQTTPREAGPTPDASGSAMTDGVVDADARSTADARQNPDAAEADHVGAAGDAPPVLVTFVATDAILVNPERGFY